MTNKQGTEKCECWENDKRYCDPECDCNCHEEKPFCARFAQHFLETGFCRYCGMCSKCGKVHSKNTDTSGNLLCPKDFFPQGDTPEEKVSFQEIWETLSNLVNEKGDTCAKEYLQSVIRNLLLQAKEEGMKMISVEELDKIQDHAREQERQEIVDAMNRKEEIWKSDKNDLFELGMRAGFEYAIEIITQRGNKK